MGLSGQSNLDIRPLDIEHETDFKILQALTMITVHHGLVELPHDGDLFAVGRGQGRQEDHREGDDTNNDVHLSQRFEED